MENLDNSNYTSDAREQTEDLVERLTGDLFARLRTTADYQHAMKVFEAVDPFESPFDKAEDPFAKGPFKPNRPFKVDSFQQFNLFNIEYLEPDYIPPSVTDINNAIELLETAATAGAMPQRDEILRRIFAYQLAKLDFDAQSARNDINKIRSQTTKKAAGYGSTGDSDQNRKTYHNINFGVFGV